MAVDKNGKPLPLGIRQRANGKYEGRVQYEFDRYSVYADTLTELKKKMTELRYKLEHGAFVASSKITVEEWFKTWMEQYKENQVKAGTIISYTDYFNIYIKEGLGKKKLVDIRGNIFRNFITIWLRREWRFQALRWFRQSLMAALNRQ